MPTARRPWRPRRFPRQNEYRWFGIDYATYLEGPESTRAWAWQWMEASRHMSPARPRRGLPDHQSADQSQHGNQIPLSGSEGAFITKFTEDGSALIFSAYMGGSEADQGNAIAVAPD